MSISSEFFDSNFSDGLAANWSRMGVSDCLTVLHNLHHAIGSEDGCYIYHTTEIQLLSMHPIHLPDNWQGAWRDKHSNCGTAYY